MENENKQNHEHNKMCDWCGNEYGRKYRWMRLVLAIVIGLFIFSAGYHLGELNVLVHQQYGSGYRYDQMETMMGNMRRSNPMMPIQAQYNQDGAGPSTVITIPAQQ